MQNTPTQARIQRLSVDIQKAETANDMPAQVTLYKELARLSPNTTLVHAKIAHLLHEMGDVEAAAPFVTRALELAHDKAADTMLFTHLPKLPLYTGNPEQARSWYQAHPSLTRFKLLHEALTPLSAYDEIERRIHELLGSNLHTGEQSQLLTLLAQVYRHQGRYHDCIGCYKLGLELTPDNPTQMLNLGAVLEHIGRHSEALACYRRLIAVDPSNAQAHNNLSITLLRYGEFELGWQQHEWRWPAIQADHEQHFAIPRWRGEPLAGKTLLVWAEQGIGDHIMYGSLLKELSLTGAKLHIEIYLRLDGLFGRSFPGINFLRRELVGEDSIGDQQVFKQSWPKADYQIPMASLCGIFRNSRESFGDGAPYLQADPARVEEFKAKYSALFPGKRLIGVSWRGGKSKFTQRQGRNVELEELASLAKLTGVQFIDLQYDSTAADIARLHAAGLQIHHDDEVDPTAMMDAQAAQISALDAVISVDNTTVHLAGALGVPTFALIQLNPDWRWGLQGSTTLWYQSVHLLRNTTNGGFQQQLEQVIEALQA